MLILHLSKKKMKIFKAAKQKRVGPPLSGERRPAYVCISPR
jgi:hypothetical protein